MSEHQFGLVFEDEVGDLFRCSCGVQDWDFAQGREAYARHLEAIAAAAGQRLVLVKWAEGFLGGLSFNEPALQKQEWAKRRAPDVAASIMAAFAAAQAPSAEPGLDVERLRRIEAAARAFSGAGHHPDCPVTRWTPESRTLRVCHCGFESLRAALAAPAEGETDGG